MKSHDLKPWFENISRWFWTLKKKITPLQKSFIYLRHNSSFHLDKVWKNTPISPNISNISKTHHFMAFFFNPKHLPPKKNSWTHWGFPTRYTSRSCHDLSSLGSRLRGQGVQKVHPWKLRYLPAPQNWWLERWVFSSFLKWFQNFPKGHDVFFGGGKNIFQETWDRTPTDKNATVRKLKMEKPCWKEENKYVEMTALHQISSNSSKTEEISLLYTAFFVFRFLVQIKSKMCRNTFLPKTR